jgi:glycosyltransferase involved in cell wall biosynthesis
MNPLAPSLSLAMIVKNEARCLARCLRSVQGIVNEIVIVDTGSTDDTLLIAREFQARLFHFPWTDDFSAARNHALVKATGDWMLVLDADEHASQALAGEILEFIRSRPAIGKLRILSDFRKQGNLLRSQSYVARLFPRGAHFEGRIHEQLISNLPRLNLRGELWHDGYLQTHKSDRNLKLLLRELEHSPANAYLLYQLALEYSSLERNDRALDCLQKAHALLGPDEPFAPNVVVDFLYALMESKRWEQGLKVRHQAARALNDFPDFHLVSGLFLMNLIRTNPAKYLAELPKIEQSFQRCLALGESDKYKSVHGAGSFLAQFNLGALYQAFGDAIRARLCFENAALEGFAPAIAALRAFPSSAQPTALSIR